MAATDPRETAKIYDLSAFRRARETAREKMTNRNCKIGPPEEVSEFSRNLSSGKGFQRSHGKTEGLDEIFSNTRF